LRCPKFPNVNGILIIILHVQSCFFFPLKTKILKSFKLKHLSCGTWFFKINCYIMKGPNDALARDQMLSGSYFSKEPSVPVSTFNVFFHRTLDSSSRIFLKIDRTSGSILSTTYENPQFFLFKLHAWDYFQKLRSTCLIMPDTPSSNYYSKKCSCYSSKPWSFSSS